MGVCTLLVLGDGGRRVLSARIALVCGRQGYHLHSSAAARHALHHAVHVAEAARLCQADDRHLRAPSRIRNQCHRPQAPLLCQ